MRRRMIRWGWPLLAGVGLAGMASLPDVAATAGPERTRPIAAGDDAPTAPFEARNGCAIRGVGLDSDTGIAGSLVIDNHSLERLPAASRAGEPSAPPRAAAPRDRGEAPPIE